MKDFKPKYSGKGSIKFWKAIHKLKGNKHDQAYTLGEVLQNIEGDILHKINLLKPKQTATLPANENNNCMTDAELSAKEELRIKAEGTSVEQPEKKIMSKEEFIQKWCFKSSPEYGSALFDCSKELREELEQQLAEKSTEIAQWKSVFEITTNELQDRIKELESKLNEYLTTKDYSNPKQ